MRRRVEINRNMNDESEMDIEESVMCFSVLSKSFLSLTDESYGLYLLACPDSKLILRKLIF
jgi:hypothetical protein